MQFYSSNFENICISQTYAIVQKSEIITRQIKVHNYRSKNRDTQSETVMCWTNDTFKMCIVPLYQVLNMSSKHIESWNLGHY
jgi:hypothetical protein